MSKKLLFSILIFGFCAAPLAMAQELANTGAERIRALNTQILQLHKQAQEGGPRMALALQKKAIDTLRQRAAELVSLMQSDPAQALAMTLSSDAVQELAAKFPAASSLLETSGEWQGPAEYVVLDDASLRSSRSVITISDGRDELQVHFTGDAPDNLKCGSILRVQGVRLGVHVVASAPSKVTTAASGGACSTTGQQKVAVILVTFPGVAPPLSASAVYNEFFGTTGRSVDGYWRDASYGLTSATGNVFGWYTLPTAYSCDQYAQLGTDAMKLADSDVVFTNYNRIFFVFPKPSGCTFGGISTVGCSTLSSADGSFTASESWLIADYMVPNDQGVELAVHEGGHGLTLNHAQSRGFAPDALGALGTAGTMSEYGDNFDPMGYYNLGHYGAQHKVQLGWLTPSNVLTVQSSGNYAIAPMGTLTASPQALKVQRGTGNPDWLWIEFHQPIGNYENALSSQIYSGATIRYQDAFTGAGYTNLLDFTPLDGSWYDPALAAGTSWVDPYSNVSLAVNSATPGALNVGVNYGAVPCNRANPTISMTPANPTVNPGAQVNYAVTLTNNDSSSCSASAFTISPVIPSGWSASMSNATMTLSPGQNTSLTMTSTVPAGAAPGTYSVSASAAGATTSAMATAYCSVMAGASNLTATISSKTGADAARDWKIQVSNSGTAIANSAEIANVGFVQTGGPSCAPVVSSGTFPLLLGNLAPAQTASGDVIIDFSTCSNSAKFTVNIALLANGGANTSTVVRNNERK